MNYPLISEYIEAIKSAEDNFEELSYLRPVLGDDGLPIMSAGGFSVVFKMKDESNGKLYAVKCFTKEQEGRAEAYREIAKELKDISSPYLASIRYMEKELFVDTDQTAETEFPVLLMDWVEGKTLDKYLRENLDDKYALEMLAYRFSQLAQWLIPQPFAHGDLKPDNILVREDGSLVLVDYDGMYVPAMKGQKARELGSPDFRHPLRTEDDFDEHIDDFSLISILLSLKAISLFPHLYNEYGNSYGMLLSKEDFHDISTCRLLKNLFPSKDTELNTIIALFVLCLRKSMIDFLSCMRLNCPEDYYSTTVGEDDIRLAIEIDDVLYSRDKRKLLRRKDDINASRDECHIIEGTEIICDYAFKMEEFGVPYTIWLPKSIIKVGKDVFTTKYLPGISEIVVPKGYEQKYSQLMPQYKHLISCFTTKVSDCEIADGEKDKYGVIYSKDGKRLLSCPNSAYIESVVIREGTKVICDGAFSSDGYSYYHNLREVIIPKSVEIIGQGTFSGCTSLMSIKLPYFIKRINCGAFVNSSINEITIPKSVEFIADLAFMSCAGLEKIRFEGYTIIQSQEVFFETNLNIIEIPKGSRVHYEHYLSNFLDKLVEKDFEIEYLTTKVTENDRTYAWTDEYGAIYSHDGKFLIKGVNIPNYDIRPGTQVIMDDAFNGCSSLVSINIPDSVTHIGDTVFYHCKTLQEIIIPESVYYIGKNPFIGCSQLCRVYCKSHKFIYVNGLLMSSDYQLLISCINCWGELEIPYYIDKIGDCAFSSLEHLKAIYMPKTIRTIGESAFSGCTQLEKVVFSVSLVSIEAYAFAKCKFLKGMELPQSLNNIGERAFSWCENLSVVCLQGMVSIADNAFFHCRRLSRIIVPTSDIDKYKVMLPQLSNVIDSIII